MGKFDLLGVDCRWKMKWQAKDERLVRDNLFRLYFGCEVEIQMFFSSIVSNSI